MNFSGSSPLAKEKRVSPIRITFLRFLAVEKRCFMLERSRWRSLPPAIKTVGYASKALIATSVAGKADE